MVLVNQGFLVKWLTRGSDWVVQGSCVSSWVSRVSHIIHGVTLTVLANRDALSICKGMDAACILGYGKGTLLPHFTERKLWQSSQSRLPCRQSHFSYQCNLHEAWHVSSPPQLAATETDKDNRMRLFSLPGNRPIQLPWFICL